MIARVRAVGAPVLQRISMASRAAALRRLIAYEQRCADGAQAALDTALKEMPAARDKYRARAEAYMNELNALEGTA